jgi:glycosyltransferase involved in cell wall biosynthesis
MTPRVLHVFKYFHPRFTGEGIFVERLASYFEMLRPDVIHDVVAIATPRPADLAMPSGFGAVHYLASGAREATQRSLILWLARNARRYRTIHYHSHVDRTLLASLFLRLSGIRLLLSATLDDSIPGILQTYRPAFRPIVKVLLKSIGRFIAISRKLFEENNRFVPPSRSEFLPVGVAIPELDAERRYGAREKLGLAPDRLVLVSVGGLCARKNQLFLVEQLPSLVRTYPTLVLLLVGPVLDMAYQGSITKRIAELGLEDNVRFCGQTDRPWDFYAAADIMVFASRMEGFGTVVIEAMAYGLPVVAWHLPGVNDMFIAHGKSGYLFTGPEQFAQGVGKLAASPVLRGAMGSAGRDFVASHYEISAIAARYLALYGFPAPAETA